MIPDERASRFKSGYKHDEKETVTFNPPLEVKEWDELMRCQVIVAKLEERQKKESKAFGTKEEKKDGQDKIKQTSKSEKPKQD